MPGSEKTTKIARPVPQQQSDQTLIRKPGEGFFNGNNLFRKPGERFFDPKPLVSPEAVKFYQGIQRKKLEVNPLGDVREQEADAVADKIMRTPTVPVSAPLFRKPEEESKMQTGSINTAPLQRKEDDEMLQTKGEGTPEVTPSFETSLQRSKGGGSPLPDEVKQQMENGIGADFGDVRVHTGTQAAQMSDSLQAQAFTHGRDIYFNEGKYNPGTNNGKHLLAHELTHTVQQGAADKVARKGENKDPDKDAIPVQQQGIVANDGKERLKLRAAPSTNAFILSELGFNTRLQVIDYPANDPSWYHVSTSDGRTGYVYKVHIRMDMPEPTAKLHRVESGYNGYAMSIARRFYYENAGVWGMDERYYVNVLAYMNKKAVHNWQNDWHKVQFNAGDLIWIPGVEFAKGLKGKIPSGSRSHDIAEFLGIAKGLEGFIQKIEDFKNAVRYSRKHLGKEIARRFKDILPNVLTALAEMIVISVGVMAVSTAVFTVIGGAIGFFAGAGAGVVIGAELGAELGVSVGFAILEWLGLAFMAGFLISAIGKIGGLLVDFANAVWQAKGNTKVLDDASVIFARAIAELLATVIEFAVVYLAGKGIEGFAARRGQLKKSKIGQEEGIMDHIDKKANEKIEQKENTKTEEKQKEEKKKERKTERDPVDVSDLVAEKNMGNGKKGYRLNRKKFENYKKIKGEPEATVKEHAAREAYAAQKASDLNNTTEVYMGIAADKFINPDAKPGTEFSADVVGVTKNGKFMLTEAKGTEITHGLEQLKHSADKLGYENVIRYELVVAEEIKTPGFSIKNGYLQLNGKPYTIYGQKVIVNTTR